MTRSVIIGNRDQNAWRIILFGILISFLVVGCSGNDGGNIVIYSFSTSGEGCRGISYGWLNELGTNEICHDGLAGGDIKVDCPTPQSVTVAIEEPEDLGAVRTFNAYITVSEDTACIARCEIWYQNEMVDSDQITTFEDHHIAYCSARIW